MYMPFFPLIANEFRISDEAVSSTLSTWLLGGATAQIILGPLSDRFGRKIVLMYGGLLFIISCILCILSTSINLMLIARFLQGVGVCSMMIAGYSCVHEIYKDKQAIKILAMMSSISILAPMIGPVIGGYLALFYNWRIVFWVLLLCAIFSIFSLYFYMPNTQPSSSKSFSKSLSIKSIFCRYINICSNHLFILNVLCFSMGYACIMLWISTSPFLLMHGYHMNTYSFGLAQLPVFGAFMVGSKITNYFIDKLLLTKIIKYAFCLTILGLMLLVPSCFLNKVELLIISISISMIAFGMLTAPLNRLAFNSSNGDKGITASVFYTFMMGSGAIITKIFGYVEYTTLNFAIVFCIIAITQILLFSIINGINNIENEV